MLIGVATFLVIFFALLAVPVTLTFRISWHQSLHSNVKLLWMFGLVRVRLASPQSKAPSIKGKELTKTVKHSDETSRKKSNSVTVIWNKAFRRRMIRFMGDVWRAVHKRNLILQIRIGLGDPADTGQLWAIVGPLAGMLSNVQAASIDITPDFFDTLFDVNSRGSIRIIPLQLIYLIIALLMSPQVWYGIKQIRAVD